MNISTGRGWCGCDEGYAAAVWTFRAGSKDRTLALPTLLENALPYTHSPHSVWS